MNDPLAYLLTWRTYGTWLHGDPRGTVDWQHNVFGTELLPEDEIQLRYIRDRMRFPSIVLNTAAREIVADIIVKHCQIRDWELHESAVRTNHVHVAVSCSGTTPDTMMSQFKAYATRALRTTHISAPRAPVWAEGGSTRYLWTAKKLMWACMYVRDGQDIPH